MLVHQILKSKGIEAIFGPGTDTRDIGAWIREHETLKDQH